MHADLTKQVKQIDGETALKEGDGKVMTLAAAASNALLAPEQGLSGEDQVKRFLLATRIYGAALPVEITVEEAALIKKCVAKVYAPLVTGQMWQVLDPSSTTSPTPPASPSRTAAPSPRTSPRASQ